MTSSRKQDNAEGPTTGIAAEGNPYLTTVANDQLKPQTDGGDELDEEAQQFEVHRAEEEKKRKQQRHRWIALVFILTLLSASIGLAVVVYRRQSTKVEYRQAAKHTAVLPPPPNASVNTTRDSRQEHAIQEVQRLTEARQAQNAEQQTARTTNAQNVANESRLYSTTETQHSFTIPSSSTATEKANSSDQDSSTTPSALNDQRHVRSQRNSETSLYVTERNEEQIQRALNSERSTTRSFRPKNEQTETTGVAPPFGSILPVRAIGGLYTLRSGALARFEVTRDMIGNAWAIKRGTILVGTTKGGEYDRAYVSIIGFIDPQSGKLVKLGGDVLGGDGATGLKGKSRQVDSRWKRVLSQVGNTAVTLSSALLGGRGDGTVVISEGRSRLINPISDELNGMLSSQSESNRRGGFVEVVAGTPGYVIVTDLPVAIKGTDANAALNYQSLATLSDVEATRSATGISEREFADLLADGSPDQIRAKLQRMTPEMRKIALAVLER